MFGCRKARTVGLAIRRDGREQNLKVTMMANSCSWTSVGSPYGTLEAMIYPDQWGKPLQIPIKEI